MASPLLSLPSELRIEIIRYVLGFCTTPATEAETEERYPVPVHTYWRPPVTRPNLTKLDFASINLVNKQMRLDAVAAAELSRPVEYHLHLVLLRQMERVIPQWTFISHPSTTIDTLRCTIRLHGKIHNGKDLTPFTGGDGGPQPAIWPFYDLVINFLRHGLNLRASKNPSSQRTHLIKHLVIDVVSPELEEDVRWWIPERHRASQQSTILRLDPGYLSAFLESHMGYLLTCDYHTGSYGCSVYEHVGKIEFRRNGVPSRTYDLDALLNLYVSTPLSHSNPAPSDLRIHYTKLMWIPLVQRLRSERGIGSENSRPEVNDPSTSSAKDDSYYMSWNECLSQVVATRPETC